jgi:hypothetical protein
MNVIGKSREEFRVTFAMAQKRKHMHSEYCPTWDISLMENVAKYHGRNFRNFWYITIEKARTIRLIISVCVEAATSSASFVIALLNEQAASRAPRFENYSTNLRRLHSSKYGAH